MKVLIIEDDPNKLNAITSFLDQNMNIEYVCHMSYQSGMRAIMSSKFDLLLLDMSMPVYDATAHDTGGRPLHLAGRDILFQLKRKKNPLKAIVITQYEDFNGVSLKNLDHNLREEFPQNYVGYVYYNITQDNWRNDLTEMLRINTQAEG